MVVPSLRWGMASVGKLRPLWPRLLVGLCSAGTYFLLRLMIDGQLVLGGYTVFRPSAGLAIPLGVLFGLPAAAGIGVGAVVAELLRTSLSVEGVLDAASLCLLASLSALAWEYSLAPYQTSRRFSRLDDWLGFAIVAAVVSVGVAAVHAWGRELFGLFPFFVTFADAALNYLLATLLVAPPFLFVLRHADLPAGMVPAHHRGDSPPISPRTRRMLVLIPLVWAIVAVVGSVGFAIRESIPLVGFRQYNAEFLYHWVHPDVFGRGGRRAQVLFGALALVVFGHVVSGIERQQTAEEGAGDTQVEPTRPAEGVSDS